MRGQGAWRQGDEGAYRLVLLLFLTLSFLAYPSQASDIFPQENGETRRTSKITSKAKLSFGYDNNVREQKENKTESRFFQFYVSSDMYMLPTERTLLSLKVQNGLKYLDASSLSGESVLINGLTLGLSHRISERLIPEIQSEIRGRTSIHSKGEVLPSEEAYLKGSVGAALRAVALSDVTLRAFCRYGFTNFEDFDPFDRRESRIGLRADVRLLPESTVSLQCSRTKTRFNKWDLVSPGTTVFRADTVDDMSFSAQIYCFFLFDVTYSHQNNKSDTDGYSYRANRFALLMAKHLPQNVMFQLCAIARYKKYRSPSHGPTATQVELEDDERGALTVKLSKDISDDCSLEIQCDLRRSSSYKDDGLYTKGVFFSSLSFHF